jgi:AraC family transcriptional regulator, transcriptional activator of pobA
MHFNKISELYKAVGAPAPENPLFSLREFDETTSGIKNTKEVSYGFYTICFKKLKSGELWYGKTKYDSDSGFMYFLKPGQTLYVHDVQIKDSVFISTRII